MLLEICRLIRISFSCLLASIDIPVVVIMKLTVSYMYTPVYCFVFCYLDHKKLIFWSDMLLWFFYNNPTLKIVWPCRIVLQLFLSQNVQSWILIWLVIFVLLSADTDVKIWMFLALHSEKTYFWFVDNLLCYYMYSSGGRCWLWGYLTI